MPDFGLKGKLIIDLGFCRVHFAAPSFGNKPNRDSVALSPDAAVQKLREELERDGVTLNRLRVGGESADDVFLTRWLNSKKRNVIQAAHAVAKHAQWRANFVPQGRIHDEEIGRELDAQKVFLQGCNRLGHALLIVLARRHDMNVRDFKQTEKLIVYTLDAASRLADIGGGRKICCLFDLSGLMLRNLDVKVLTTIFELLQRHYPERLGMIWFVNAPFIFWAVWRVVSPLIEECSREKIHFVSCSNNRCSSFLQDSVAPNVLPWCYGGQAEMIPIDAASQQLLQGTITDPSQLSLRPVRHHIAAKESWRAWLKRHKKLSRIAGWITSSCKAAVQNRFSRYLWTKVKTTIWKRKEQVHLTLPKGFRQQTTLQSFMNPEPQPYPLASFIVKLVMLDVGLILVGVARTAIYNATWTEN